MQKLSSNEEHFHLFQDFIFKVTATFLILTAISELPYYARLKGKEVCCNINIWVKNLSWGLREEVKYVTKSLVLSMFIAMSRDEEEGMDGLPVQALSLQLLFQPSPKRGSVNGNINCSQRIHAKYLCCCALPVGVLPDSFSLPQEPLEPATSHAGEPLFVWFKLQERNHSTKLSFWILSKMFLVDSQ